MQGLLLYGEKGSEMIKNRKKYILEPRKFSGEALKCSNCWFTERPGEGPWCKMKGMFIRGNVEKRTKNSECPFVGEEDYETEHVVKLIEHIDELRAEIERMTVECHVCGGDGKILTKRGKWESQGIEQCPECGGKGRLKKTTA